MVGVLTITSKTGPGLTVTSKVITGIANMNFDLTRGVLSITTAEEPQFSGPVQEYTLASIATVTCTISGTTWTWSLT